MAVAPEAQARAAIDTLLAAAGWAVLNMAGFNRRAAEGIAMREFPLPSGPCDYLQSVGGKACGVIEAKVRARRRQMPPLVTAGKTFTAFSFSWRLEHAKAKRVLCLVDRNDPGDRALEEYQEFDPPGAAHRFGPEAIRAPSLRTYFEELRVEAAGGVQPNLNSSTIKQTLRPTPPLAAIQVVCDRVEVRLSPSEAVGVEVSRRMAAVHGLRQAVLKEAFSGQLAPQDPMDEPASALLVRPAQQAAEGPSSPLRRAGPEGTAA